MKVLISAIACDPSGGSEGGVGWHTVNLIAKEHEVFVLVHGKYQRGWQQALKQNMIPSNVTPRFICREVDWIQHRLAARIQSWVQYLHFNQSLFDVASDWHKEVCFDLAHHVTYATWRVASPLWRLPIPFIWGPIGGTGRFPFRFMPALSNGAKLYELARYFQGCLTIQTRQFRNCTSRSTFVIAANRETYEFIKRYRREGKILELAAVFFRDEKISQFTKPLSVVRQDARIRLFAGGNMIGSKGLRFAVKALSIVNSFGIPFHYTIAGGGPEIQTIRNLVSEYRLSHVITFHPGFTGSEYVEALKNSDIYFLPSFRETTPVTLIEAMLAGCYPIVADVSAPGQIVREFWGTAVAAKNSRALIDGLAKSVISMFNQIQSKGSLAPPQTLLNKLKTAFSEKQYLKTINYAYDECKQLT